MKKVTTIKVTFEIKNKLESLKYKRRLYSYSNTIDFLFRALDFYRQKYQELNRTLNELKGGEEKNANIESSKENKES